jgi:hypothetical protein
MTSHGVVDCISNWTSPKEEQWSLISVWKKGKTFDLSFLLWKDLLKLKCSFKDKNQLANDLHVK